MNQQYFFELDETIYKFDEDHITKVGHLFEKKALADIREKIYVTIDSVWKKNCSLGRAGLSIPQGGREGRRRLRRRGEEMKYNYPDQFLSETD